MLHWISYDLLALWIETNLHITFNFLRTIFWSLIEGVLGLWGLRCNNSTIFFHICKAVHKFLSFRIFFKKYGFVLSSLGKGLSNKHTEEKYFAIANVAINFQNFRCSHFVLCSLFLFLFVQGNQYYYGLC